MNRLTIEYYDSDTKVRIFLLEQKVGFFTLAEKFLDQLADFYKDLVISVNELAEHVNNFFLKSKMKTHLLGIFALYYKIYKLFPDLKISISSNQRDSIFFLVNQNTCVHFFVVKKEEGLVSASDRFNFKYEALDFLYFLYAMDLYSEETFLNIETTIDNSYLMDGTYKSIRN